MKRLDFLLYTTLLVVLHSCGPGKSGDPDKKPTKKEEPATLLIGTQPDKKTKVLIMHSVGYDRDTVFFSEDTKGGQKKVTVDPRHEDGEILYYRVRMEGNRRSQGKLFLAHGDTLRMDVIQGKKLPEIAFDGAFRTESRLLSRLTSSLTDPIKAKELYSQPSDAFLHMVDSLRVSTSNELQNALDTVEGEVHEGFRSLMESYITYSGPLWKIQYEAYYNYLNQGKDSADLTFDPYKIGDLDLEPSGLVVHHNRTYRRFLSQYFMDKANEEIGSDGDKKTDKAALIGKYLDMAENRIDDQEVRDLFLFHSFFNHLRSNGSVGIADKDLERYAELSEDAFLTQKIEDQYKNWKKVAPGNKAPGFKGKTVDGKEYSLEDFKGKLVYVDVWASWCGPCKREYPFLEELHGKVDKDKVAIVGVSVDSKEKNWKNMVESKEMIGTQILTEGAFDSKITQDYVINGIPRFLLIGPDGKVIDPNAPRPSGNAYEVIAEHVKEMS